MDGLAVDFSFLGRELCPITSSLSESGYEYAIIGATAILLHGYNILRATRDVDLVIAIEGGFPAVEEVLMQIGLQRTNISHRYMTERGLQLDVLPVTDVDKEERTIQMPGGGNLSALGLSEAVRSRTQLNLEGCAVAVAAVPVLVALKLIAAVERVRSDLEDSCVCLSEYAIDDIRRHLAHYDHSSVLTYETSGAYVAGADLVQRGGEQFLSSTREALARLRETQTSLIRVARSLGMEEGKPAALLEALAMGMETGRIRA